MRFRLAERLLVILIFFAGLVLVLLDSFFFKLDPSPAIEENRYLAKAPKIRETKSLAEFRNQFQKYHRDHLGFRNYLIRSNSLVRIRVLGVSQVKAGDATVFVGADDWLYFGYSLRDYRGVQRLNRRQFEWWKHTLQARSKALKDKSGIPYLFFAAPSKGSVYPEYLPSLAARKEGPLAFDELVKFANDNPDVEILDLRPRLRQAKKLHQLYWKTDHHWNDVGGLVAVAAIVEYLQKWFPDEPLIDTTKMECKETIQNSGTSLARIIGLSGFYPEIRHQPNYPSWDKMQIDHTTDATTGDRIWINRSNPNGLRVVCIGDSFTFSLIPGFTHQFSSVYWVSRFSPDYKLDDLMKVIDKVNPDIVLEERTEWGLLEVPQK